MVHLSNFADFQEDLNGNTFNIATQLQIIINVKITISKVHYTNMSLRHSQPRFSAPITFNQLEPYMWIRPWTIFPQYVDSAFATLAYINVKLNF